MAHQTTMHASPVFFWNLRTSRKAPYDLRIRRLLKRAEVASRIQSGDFVAIKIHFGEKGNTGFISPLYVKPIIDFLRKSGAKPYLTDTNTLYIGERGDSVSHCLQAARHGFDPNILGAPVIIADGIKSRHEIACHDQGHHFELFYLAGDIVNADYLINLSHFKGHEICGFGGALKNLGMGCASRRGKMQQHCQLGPRIHPERCQGCGQCLEVCQPGALSLNNQGKISIDRDLCLGCAACLSVCQHGGLEVDWNTKGKGLWERMIEYAKATLKQFSRPPLHINFVLSVSPACDCVGYTDAPMCPDLGVLSSYDPVALDQACLDLVNQAPAIYPHQEPSNPLHGQDKFQALHPNSYGNYGLEYAHKLGLGQRDYDLIVI
jgi:hypothetical protein